MKIKAVVASLALSVIATDPALAQKSKDTLRAVAGQETGAKNMRTLSRGGQTTNPDGLPALWRRSAAVDGAPARGDANSLLKTSLMGSRDFYP